MKWFFSTLVSLGIRNHRTFRLLLRGIAIIVGLVAGFVSSFYLDMQAYRTSVAVFSLVVIAALVEFIAADILAELAFPYETELKLKQMERQLGVDAIRRISDRLQRAIAAFRACDTKQISATVHLIAEVNNSLNAERRRGLLQLTDYVGPHGGKKGRATELTQGLIGCCARTLQQECVDFAHEAEYLDRMVRHFGFTKEEAMRHTHTGRSYLAVPLMHGLDFVGVMYFFSTESQVFPRAARSASLTAIAKEIVDDLKMARLV